MDDNGGVGYLRSGGKPNSKQQPKIKELALNGTVQTKAGREREEPP